MSYKHLNTEIIFDVMSVNFKFNISIENSLKNIWKGDVFLLGITLENIRFKTDFDSIFNKELLKIDYSALNNFSENIWLSRMRDTFKSMPSMNYKRYPPASEAIINRINKKGFFYILPLVNINNLLSSKLSLPIGIYDINKLSNLDFIYRLGSKDDKYFTLNDKIIDSEGKIILSDLYNVIGSPIVDSNKANISENTNNVLIIVYLPFHTNEVETLILLDEIKSVYNSLIDTTNFAYKIFYCNNK